MPSKNMNEYMKQRWIKRRKAAVEFLGGKCVKCGTENNLQFDHIDPKTKYKTIAKLSSASEKIFWNEIKKCQLLCNNCHFKKTLKDFGQQDAKATHGTLSSFRYCKCDECKQAKSNYMKEWWKKKTSSKL